MLDDRGDVTKVLVTEGVRDMMVSDEETAQDGL